MKALLLHASRLWLVIAVAVSGLSGLAFVLMQQDLRDGANDPQIQMAEDAARSLASGSTATTLVPHTPVDVAASLAPFLVVYDSRNNVVASSATLFGRTPELPAGVLNSARSHGEDRVTWQAAPGVRIAAVIVPYRGSGAVLAGRSLRVVEQRESDLLGTTVVVWLFTIVAVAATILGIDLLTYRNRSDRAHAGSSA